MALALVVDNLDTVPEALKAMYIEKDGKFALDVEGLPDVTGLTTALASERKIAKDAEKLRKETELKYAGIDIEEMKGIKAMLETNAEAKLISEGKIEEVLKARVEKRDADWQLKLDAAAELVNKANTSKDRFKDGMLDDRLRAAFNGIVAPGSMEGAILAAKHTQRFSLDDDGNAVQYDASGNMVIGKDNTPFSPKEWINDSKTKEAYAYLYPPTGTGGGDRQTNGKFNNAGQLMDLPAAERMAAARKMKI